MNWVQYLFLLVPYAFGAVLTMFIMMGLEGNLVDLPNNGGLVRVYVILGPEAEDGAHPLSLWHIIFWPVTLLIYLYLGLHWLFTASLWLSFWRTWGRTFRNIHGFKNRESIKALKRLGVR